ncbi:hypothetical protein HPB48_005713 [Haemaphysalis longicornis]|uniref:Uncharacterized protein n=1 Tax=Haemaphysalis longicornis TaxID=44386 RepID=A0A9J6FBB4_HAELO|nr:hypothetical protein HPB48_005713 [Haemaphysalis longicornis]
MDRTADKYRGGDHPSCQHDIAESHIRLQGAPTAPQIRNFPANYTRNTKVHVFKLPREERLRNAWIHPVPRENLTVTENSGGRKTRTKWVRMEHAALQKAIAESNEAFDRASELASHLRSQEMKFWSVIEKNERLLIIHIVKDEAPWLKYSVSKET